MLHAVETRWKSCQLVASQAMERGMDWEEAKSKSAKALVVGEDLSTFSVGELDARVAALEAELTRIRREIDSKRARSAAAADLFKR